MVPDGSSTGRDTDATAFAAALRASAVAALQRRYGITGLAESAVLPVIGTKELIAWLPSLLGLGDQDVVVVPELAYPTYEVGARLAGARWVRSDAPPMAKRRCSTVFPCAAATWAIMPGRS